MKTLILNDDALSAVPPSSLAAFAKSFGWSKARAYGEQADIYSGNELPEILVPKTQRAPSYPQLVQQLLLLFSQAAKIDEGQVYQDLLVANRDVVRFRAPGKGDGTVSVDNGLTLVSRAVDVLAAAAASLDQPRAVYRPRKNKAVADLLAHTRLGQTEHGSYVVTLLAPPIAPRLQRTLFDEDPTPEPFERRATLRLVEAALAARNAAQNADPEAFLAGTEQGISANLCEGLAALIEPFDGVDVSVTWAKTRPREQTREQVSFGSDDMTALREAARVFREREPIPDVTIIGFVEVLAGKGGGAPGEVVIRGTLDGKPISARMSVDSDTYDKMIHAHEERRMIAAEGDLERSGRHRTLRRPRLSSVPLEED